MPLFAVLAAAVEAAASSRSAAAAASSADMAEATAAVTSLAPISGSGARPPSLSKKFFSQSGTPAALLSKTAYVAAKKPKLIPSHVVRFVDGCRKCRMSESGLTPYDGMRVVNTPATMAYQGTPPMEMTTRTTRVSEANDE